MFVDLCYYDVLNILIVQFAPLICHHFSMSMPLSWLHNPQHAGLWGHRPLVPLTSRRQTATRRETDGGNNFPNFNWALRLSTGREGRGSLRMFGIVKGTGTSVFLSQAAALAAQILMTD